MKHPPPHHPAHSSSCSRYTPYLQSTPHPRTRSPAWHRGAGPGPCLFVPSPLCSPQLLQSGSTPRPSLDLFYTLQGAMVSPCVLGTCLAFLVHFPVIWQVSGHKLASSASSLRAGTEVSIFISSNLQNPVQCLAYIRWVLLFCFHSEWINIIWIRGNGRHVRSPEGRRILINCCWQSKK